MTIRTKGHGSNPNDRRTQTKTRAVSVLFIILALSTISWILIHSRMLAASQHDVIQYAEWAHLFKGGTKTCIAMGVFSRTTEVELRQWHRDVFNSLDTRAFEKDVAVHLLFSVSKNPNPKIMKEIHAEQEVHNDLIILDVEERYELSTMRGFELM